MPRLDKLIIADDQQLEQYGIFTAASAREESAPFVTRRNFQDTQREELDSYPTDTTFEHTLIALIEGYLGERLLHVWGEQSQAVGYICQRRVSQPDFVIPATTASELLLKSRYRRNALADDRSRGGMNRYNIKTLHGAIERAGYGDVPSFAELERTVRLSGDIFMTPPWRGDEIAQDPFMLSIGDFMRHIKRLKVEDTLAHAAFRYIGRELLDEAKAESSDTHEFAHDFLTQPTWIDGAIGHVTLDSAAAYRVVFERWRELVRQGERPNFRDKGDSWRYTEEGAEERASQVIQLAQVALSDRIPPTWFNREAQFAPPPRETDFDF